MKSSDRSGGSRQPGRPKPGPLAIGVATLLAGIYAPIQRLAAVGFGREQLFYDGRVWRRVGRAVLDGGALYVGVARDNKPPLFQAVNLLAAATGHWHLAFVGLLGFANGVALWLFYRWCHSRLDCPRPVALVALVLVALSLPQLGLNVPNSRSFALVFLFGALLARQWLLRGILVAAAGLFTQWAVVGAPMVLAVAAVRDRVSAGAVARYTAGGLGLVALAYSAVVALWGIEAGAAAIRYSLLGAGLGGQPAANLWVQPVQYVYYLLARTGALWYILLPAGGLIGSSFVRGEWPERVVVPGAYAAVFASPLLVKSLPYYYAFTIPFVTVLAAQGIQRGTRTLVK